MCKLVPVELFVLVSFQVLITSYIFIYFEKKISNIFYYKILC